MGLASSVLVIDVLYPNEIIHKMTNSSWTIYDHSFVFLATPTVIQAFMSIQTLSRFFLIFQEKKSELCLLVFITNEMDFTS